MGFFDDVKNSLTEKSQDLSKKAKDTTEIYRLNNANKSMEKEVEKLIYQIGLRYYANYKDECAEKCPDLIEQIDHLSDNGGRISSRSSSFQLLRYVRTVVRNWTRMRSSV